VSIEDGRLALTSLWPLMDLILEQEGIRRVHPCIGSSLTTVKPIMTGMHRMVQCPFRAVSRASPDRRLAFVRRIMPQSASWTPARFPHIRSAPTTPRRPMRDRNQPQSQPMFRIGCIGFHLLFALAPPLDLSFILAFDFATPLDARAARVVPIAFELAFATGIT
jgi:hypothetical protein